MPELIHRPRIVRVESVKAETPRVRTIFFRDDRCSRAEPGQFVMLWIPGVDEIPISVSTANPDGLAGITVAEVGEATRALCSLRPGALIGVRGPYGRGFRLRRGRVLVVGGGVGMAPLAPLTERLVELGSRVRVIVGARTGNELIFWDRLSRLLPREDLIAVTEDGSRGRRGLATDVSEEELERERYDAVYTCGKEVMMRKVFEQAERLGIELQASLERYMKCGMGICGQCVLDPLGLRVCVDGPVFDSRILRELTDFGAFRRDVAGRKVAIERSVNKARTPTESRWSPTDR